MTLNLKDRVTFFLFFFDKVKLTLQLIQFNTLTNGWITHPAFGDIGVLILVHSKSNYKSVKFSFWVSVEA